MHLRALRLIAAVMLAALLCGCGSGEVTSLAVYRCDDVYRTEYTPTHGGADVTIPLIDDFEVYDCQALLCDDGCDPTDVVNRAVWGYAPPYRIDEYAEYSTADGWKYPARRYFDANETANRRRYIYLLTADEQNYVYIALEPKSAEATETESDSANAIIKRVRIKLTAPEPPDFNATVIERDGLRVPIPNEYVDRLYIPEKPTEEWYADHVIVEIYEKRSYDEYFADHGGVCGLLYGLLRYTAEEYASYLTADGSGLSFFARDDEYYYGIFISTSVEFYRSGVSSYTDADYEPWEELWSQQWQLIADFTEINGLDRYVEGSDYRRGG